MASTNPASTPAAVSAAASLSKEEIADLVAAICCIQNEVRIDFGAYAAALGLPNTTLGKFKWMSLKTKLGITSDVKDGTVTEADKEERLKMEEHEIKMEECKIKKGQSE